MDEATVHLVDDNSSFLTAMTRLLRAAGYVVLSYQSATEFLEHLPAANSFGCILLDVRIPDLSGTDLQESLNKHGSHLPIIFLTGYGDIPMSVAAIKAGAEDFLTKPIARDTLLDAIEAALARHKTALTEAASDAALRDRLGSLTPRERQVFDQVVRGRMNKEIARDLGATERTIKAHRHRIMEKIDTRSLAELILVAVRTGVLSRTGAETNGDQESGSR